VAQDIERTNVNADQKKRIAHEISNWKNACNCRAVQLTGDRMAALLQELADAPEVLPATNPSQISSSAEPFGYFKAEPFGWTDCAEKDDGAIALYTAPPAPSVPDGWRYVIPGRRRTEKFDSSRVGDYNQGWNDCRKITEKALNDLEKRK